MSGGNFIRAFKEFGIKDTLLKLFGSRTLKFGTLVGVDEMGNKYYENTEEYSYGQHRWYEHPLGRAWYDHDQSEVPAGWHAWLHCITDAPPSERTDAPYERNLGGVISTFTSNPTQKRPRGYGVGNGIGTTGLHEEAFWTQPGYPLDPRHGHPKTESMPSITDTAESVLKLEATFAPSGLSEDDEDFLAEHDADDLHAAVSKYRTIVEAYGDLSLAEAVEGVEEAHTLLAAAEADLSRHTELSAKLEAASRA